MLTSETLPLPPANKIGWPWTEQTQPLPELMQDGSPWPRISVVTPSYNQGEFIEETIRSVLLQGYPNLEYIIIDGGSTDNTVNIIKKYEQYISYWVSEPDQGQSHALNKGFSKATGDLIGWQNSDDYYAPGVFQYIAEASQKCNVDVFYGTVDVIDNNRNVMLTLGVQDFELEKMLPLFNLGNQSMFFRSKIFEDGFYISEKFDHFMDFDFFWRLIINQYIFCFVAQSHGYLRIHEKTKGTNQIDKASKELFETYKTPYLHDEKNVISIEFKKKLLKAMKSVCLDNFAKSRNSIFRNQVRQILAISGWKFIDIDIYLKYLVSYLGLGVTLQKTKRMLNIPPSVYNI